MNQHITYHAYERFKQRNRLALAGTQFPKAVMSDLLKNAKPDVMLKLYPFYKNKMGISDRLINGPHHFYMTGDRVVTYVRKSSIETRDWRF